MTDLEAIEQRWNSDGGHLAIVQEKRRRCAPTDIAALLAEVKRLRERLKAAEKVCEAARHALRFDDYGLTAGDYDALKEAIDAWEASR